MKKTDFKIHILYEFTEAPWGGGNQFLKALRDYFGRQGVYTEGPAEANIILFNSHHYLDELLEFKKRHPGKLLLHRVDGPISYVRGRDKAIDKIIFQFNNFLADGTVFQSNWSRDMNYELGIKKAPYETTIINAPAPEIFNRQGKSRPAEKIRLIATSWSGNIRRGFDTYEYLDKHLDFNRYEMTFVGNSPIEFKNIQWIKPVPSRELADILREHDIYITASKNDPCSNSLIEALHCGLPAVARNDGGHPEIIRDAGELFRDESDIIEAIEKVSGNYDHYQQRISLPTIDEVGQRYYDFARSIYNDCSGGGYQPKRINGFGNLLLKMKLLQWQASNRLCGAFGTLRKVTMNNSR